VSPNSIVAAGHHVEFELQCGIHLLRRAVPAESTVRLSGQRERCPTDRQSATLRLLAAGSAGTSWEKTTDPLLEHGRLTAEPGEHDSFFEWVRITRDGLRTAASGVERSGPSEIKREAVEVAT
jgi:hypothetical protein